jgi:hypothetical protein
MVTVRKHFTPRDRFCGGLISQAKIKRLHVKVCIFFLLLNKFEISVQIFMNVSNVKFHGNSSGESSADTCRRKDGGSDGKEQKDEWT